MTTQNYTQYTNEELIFEVEQLEYVSTDKLSRYIKNFNIDLFNEIVNRTSFLNQTYYKNNVVPILARLYCIRNNINEPPMCSVCHKNEVKWRNGINRFSEHCCPKCAYDDKKVKEKKENTNLSIYGVKNPSQSEDVKKLVRQTYLKTMYDKYGVDNPSKIQWVKDKIKNTNLTRRGVECSFGSKQVRDKRRKTMIERYGVEHPIQSSQIKQKMYDTNEKRFGCINSMQNEEVRIKQINSLMKHFGVDCPMKSQEVKEKRKQTLIRNFGVDVPMRSEQILNKAKETNIKRYGVDNYSKTYEFHKKVHKSYANPKYPDMTFGSSWEFLIYDFLKEHNIEFEYQPSMSFEYEYDGKIHTYHPDFKVGDRIFEVKGEQFFRINESTGKEEMFCPYRYDDWTNEYYDYLCGLYEAKHQCMISNNVIILRHEQIKNLSIETFKCQGTNAVVLKGASGTICV